MQNLIFFIIRYYVFLLFLVLEIISGILLITSNEFHKAGFLNSANMATGYVYSTRSNIKNYFGLRAINDSLMAENARLHTQEYSRLSPTVRDTIIQRDTTYNERFVYISAKVLDNSIYKRNNYLLLNKGSEDGVETEMGVVSDKSVVGIVMNVSRHYCTVLSLLNSKSGISAKVDQTNFFGTVKWDGKDARLAQMDDLNKHVQISIGQKISTSGHSAAFPRNIEIGTIRNFSIEGAKNFYMISIGLSTNFENINSVYIVKNLDKAERDSLEQKLPK